MIGCGLSVVGIWLIGTVFQTALLYLFLPPRLRPGLLSLRSVLASSQILLQRFMVITNSRKWASV